MTYIKTPIKPNKLLSAWDETPFGILYTPDTETHKQLGTLRAYSDIKRFLDEDFMRPAISSYLTSEEQEIYPLFLAAGRIEDPQIARNATLALYDLIHHKYQRREIGLALSKLLNLALISSSTFLGVKTTELVLQGASGDLLWFPAISTTAAYAAAFFWAKNLIFPEHDELKEHLEQIRTSTIIDYKTYKEIFPL